MKSFKNNTMKNKIIINQWIAFCTLLVLTACNPDTFAPVVEVKLPAGPKALVPNMYLEQGIGASMFIGQTQEVLNNNPNFFVNNATIELYENGVLKTGWQKVNNIYVLPNFTPTPGNVYTTKITAAGFPVAEAIDTMPNPIQFTVVKTGKIKYAEFIEFDGPFGQNTPYADTLVEIKMSFTDDGYSQDFYRIIVMDNDSTGKSITPSSGNGFNDYRSIKCLDAIYQNNSALFGGGDEDISLDRSFFTDFTFNGKQKEISFYVPIGLNNPNRKGYNKAYFYLQHISKNAYLHATSLLNVDSEEGIFSQPSLVYSNYKNGFGILGSQSTKVIGIQVK
jgi:Domain of unknown function (DUF4249)